MKATLSNGVFYQKTMFGLMHRDLVRPAHVELVERAAVNRAADRRELARSACTLSAPPRPSDPGL